LERFFHKTQSRLLLKAFVAYFINGNLSLMDEDVTNIHFVRSITVIMRVVFMKRACCHFSPFIPVASDQPLWLEHHVLWAATFGQHIPWIIASRPRSVGIASAVAQRDEDDYLYLIFVHVKCSQTRTVSFKPAFRNEKSCSPGSLEFMSGTEKTPYE
jgi:hypothetical protein